MCVTMASRSSSQFPNLDKNETAYAEFIKDKIEKAGGQIKFQHITGHLSQLEHSVREAVGAGPLQLRSFLKKHSEYFAVDNDGFVVCQKASVPPPENPYKSAKVVDKSDNVNESGSLFPETLKEVPGIVIKVLPKFGFIAIKNPKTTVYFTPANVHDNNLGKDEDRGMLLTDFPDMLPGKKVLVNAKKGNHNVEAKYRATRVWAPSNVKNEVLHPEGFHPKVSKTDMYEPVSIEGSGKIQKVFEQFGFITNDVKNENIFFHKSKVSNVQNITNLAKVFSPGDLVEFKAIRSSKKDKIVKWEASKVWIKKQGKSSLFKTDPSEKDSQSQKGDKQANSSNFRQVLKSEPGKIYPHNDGVVIKFGKNDAELADADSCNFYVHGSKVLDVCWEFSDADRVEFDAMRIKSAPGWKALLGWVGERPDIVINMADFTELSDDDSVPMKEEIIPARKQKVFENKEFSNQHRKEYSSDKQPKRNYSSDRSKVFKPTPVASSSRSNSKSRTSVDRDYDLNSEDTMSTVSGDSRTNTFTRTRRRHRRPRSKPANALQKASSYSSLADSLDSEDSYNTHEAVEYHNSEVNSGDMVPNIVSEATLKPSSSFESLDLKDCLKPSSDYQNWGDTPYPDDEMESIPPSSPIPNTDTINQDRQPTPVKMSASSQLKSLKEMFLVSDEDEFSDAVQDGENVPAKVIPENPIVDSKVPNVLLENSATTSDFADIMNTIGSLSETAVNKKPSPKVQFLSDLDGNIENVFCKYAEISHPKLMKDVSVLWSDLYHNGVPIADKFDDMKEVIKRNQTIKFNCIQIVDDNGACWLKVTVAWKGQKPRVTETTPQEYIGENFLKVSVPESDFDFGHLGPSTTKTLTPPVTESKVPPPPKKFLALADLRCDDEDDNDEDKDEDESSSDEDNADPQVDIGRTSPVVNDVASTSSLEDDLEDAVARAISSFSESDMDLKVATTNIINLVKSKLVMEVPKTSAVLHYCPESEKRPTASQPMKMRNEMKNSETQTIITGDVIAQSIFTL